MISHHRRILVEGIGDQRAVGELLDSICSRSPKTLSRDEFDVDPAEFLMGDGFEDTRGNREKVELVCKIIAGTGSQSKLAGLAGREFREFDLAEVIRDNIDGHHYRAARVDERSLYGKLYL